MSKTQQPPGRAFHQRRTVSRVATHLARRWRLACALILVMTAVQAREADAADTFEPNDTRATAAPIDVGTPVVSYVSTSGDVDFYEFTVPSWQHLRFDLTVPDTADYLMYVYSATDTEGYSNRIGNGLDERAELTLDPGTYYLEIRGWNGDPLDDHDPANPYTLSISVLAGDLMEPDNTMLSATQLGLGTSRSAYVFTSLDQDYYRIEVPVGGHLHITLDVPGTNQYDIQLLNSAGLQIGSPPGSVSQLPAGSDREIVMTVPAGSYFVRVFPRGTYSQTEQYVIRAAAGFFDDSYEPNGSRFEAQPIAPGTFVSKRYTRNDEDYYRINVSTESTVSVVLEVPPSLDLGLTLFRWGAEAVSSNVTGNGIDEWIVMRLRPGIHYIQVFSLGFSSSTTESYRLTVAGSAVRPLRAVASDFDGDRVADATVYRPSTGTWHVRNQFAVQFGEPGDIPVSGDYDGDSLADVAVYRPSTGTWYVRNQFAAQFGDRGDIPVPGDYNGDGLTDIAVYRPSTGYWYVRNLLAVQYGGPGDLPVPADYDGDGAIDLAVYRRATMDWFVRNQFVARFGEPGAVPVPGDYDGDGRAELAVYRTPSGHWLVRGRLPVQIGGAGFRPVPADFTNDGATDMAVYELSTGAWTVVSSAFSPFAPDSFTFGEVGDIPIPHQPLTLPRAAHDFDGDGTTDVGLYRPGTGEWLIHNRPTTQYGDAGDRPVPADYDRDGVVDVAVYRPSTGMWFVRNQFAVQFGDPNDVPIPGDYNGDGAADVAVYRPSTGTWYVRNQFAVQFGDPNDIPVPGDYNGDGVTDIAVYRPSTGLWYVRNQLAVRFGEPGDVIVPADYDGDGRTDVAVFRPSTNTWHVRNQFSVSSGTPSDIPVPGDYNGDGRADIAVYRPATRQWVVVYQFSIEFGNAGDVPLVRGAWSQ